MFDPPPLFCLGHAAELEELEKVAFWILEGRNPEGVIVRPILDELDSSVLQTLPVGRDVVGRQADHVPGGIAVGAAYLVVRAERERWRHPLAEHGESRVVEGHWEPQDIPLKRKQIVHVLSPDRCTAQSRDHRFAPFAFEYPLNDMHYAERTRLDPSLNGVDSAPCLSPGLGLVPRAPGGARLAPALPI